MEILNIKPKTDLNSFPERLFIMRFLKKLKEKKSLKGKLEKDASLGDYIHLEADIRLAYYKKSLTIFNLFKRDANCCVYCGSQKKLSMSYLIPLAKGGRKRWKNTVTACKNCITKKGDRTAKEAGMIPKKRPCQPRFKA